MVHQRQADLKCPQVGSFDLLHIFQLGMEGEWLGVEGEWLGVEEEWLGVDGEWLVVDGEWLLFQVFAMESLLEVGVVSVIWG